MSDIDHNVHSWHIDSPPNRKGSTYRNKQFPFTFESMGGIDYNVHSWHIDCPQNESRNRTNSKWNPKSPSASYIPSAARDAVCKVLPFIFLVFVIFVYCNLIWHGYIEFTHFGWVQAALVYAAHAVLFTIAGYYTAALLHGHQKRRSIKKVSK